MSSKMFGARHVTLTSRPDGAAAPIPWSPPKKASYERRAKQAPAGSGAQVGAEQITWTLHRTEQRVRPQNEPEESHSTC